jgi:hypothetical protein
MQENYETLKRERQLEEILLSDDVPITKVRKIMAMGVDETDAEDIVSSYQAGQNAPVYYERLDFDDDLELSDRSGYIESDDTETDQANNTPASST